jgi:hypothetical protein
VSVVRDPDKRAKLVSAIMDSTKRKWSRQAEQDMGFLGLTKEALIKALSDRIKSGLEIEETGNRNPRSGEVETAYQTTFNLEKVPLFVKCKFFEYDGNEYLRIYSVHKNRKMK